MSMQEEDDYMKLINKYEKFHIDPIQFYININTNVTNKQEDMCLICHEIEGENWVKNKCCNGYFHNSCYYKFIESKYTSYDDIIIKFKKVKYFDIEYKIITNNINITCAMCRKKLNICDDINFISLLKSYEIFIPIQTNNIINEINQERHYQNEINENIDRSRQNINRFHDELNRNLIYSDVFQWDLTRYMNRENNNVINVLTHRLILNMIHNEDDNEDDNNI